MQDTPICPYYGQNEDACDVGCGYISSHDANMIIKYCSCQYQSCQKYQQLSDQDSSATDCSPSHRPVAPAPAEAPGALPVLGLFSFGVTAAIYALDKLPNISIDLHLLAVIIMVGASGLISSGLTALKSNPLKAIAFTGFGLFWLSILALDVLPRAGYGSMPGRIPMTGYLAMWGMFSMIICQGYEQLAKISRLAFAMMTAFLLLLSLSHMLDNRIILYAAVSVGVVGSLPGIVVGLQRVWRDALQVLQAEDVIKTGKIH